MNGDLIVIALYGAVMLGVGWYAKTRATSRDDYLLAGRRLGYGMYLGTLSAVVLGGASTIGTMRLGYVHGLSGVWLVFMLGFGVVVLSLLFPRTISKLRLYTITGLLAARYHQRARRLGGVVMAFCMLMVAVTNTIAIAAIAQGLLHLPHLPATLVVGMVVVLYSAWGGMWSITLTDICQFAIMTIGILAILLPAALRHGGGWAALHARLPASFFSLDAIGYPTIAGFFLLYTLGILIGQDIWQRLFTARNEQVLRYAGLGAGVYCILYGLACAIIGMAGRTFLPPLDHVDQAFARITLQVLPTPWRGVVVSAALAAIMSTASAALLGCTTVLRQDVLGQNHATDPDPNGLRGERTMMLCMGCIMVLIASLMDDVIGALNIAYNLLVGSLLVPTLGALLWRRANATGAWLAMGAGALAAIGCMVVQGIMAPMVPLWSLLASMAGFVAGSLSVPATASQSGATGT